MRTVLSLLFVWLVAWPVEAALDKATGTLNVTTATAGNTVVVGGLGFEPKVLCVTWTGRTAVGSGAASINRGFGCATGTSNRWAVGSRSTNGVGTMNTGGSHAPDALIVTSDATDVIDGLMDLQSFDAGGFTLVIDDQFPIDLLVHYLVLGGSTITGATTGFFTPAGTAPVTQTVTGLGFTPTAILFASAVIANDAQATIADSRLSLGAMTGAGQQGTTAVGADDNIPTSVTAGYSTDLETYATLVITSPNRTIGNRAEFSALASGQFTINWLERANTGRVFYLALAGVSAQVGSLLTQTDTVTAIATATFAFAPKAALVVSSGMAESIQDTPDPNPGDLLSVGFGVSASERSAATTLDENSAGSGLTEAATADTATAIYQRLTTNDTVDALMDITAFNADSISFIMDDADASQRFAWYLVFGETGGGGGPSNAPLLLLLGVGGGLLVVMREGRRRES